MAVPPEGKRRLRADDWTAAALAAVADGGLAAVAVEPLAARLGATKGSFYWHFPHRGALVVGALERWERESTEQVIAEMDTEPDPLARLRRLFGAVTRAATGTAVELALRAGADHPHVAPVLHRVTARRIRYVTDLFVQLGFPPDAARHRGLLAVSAYVGHLSLVRSAPAELPTDAAGNRRYLDAVVGALVAR